VVSPLLAQQSANELRADLGLKKLADRFADDKADREKLRQDVLTFRRSFPGTAQAVKAAEMLRQLPSPLDALDPSKIRPLEVFKWQPKELVAILGEHRGRQGAAATCVAYSPDRKFVASGGAHLVRVWETDPKRQLRLLLNLGASNVSCIAISPDNKMLAAGSIGYIHLFDLDGENSKLRLSIPAGSTTITGVAFDPKGKPILACGSYDTKVRFFDLEKKDPKRMEISLLAKHLQSVNGVAYSPDGVHLASGSSDGTVRLWRYDGVKTDEACKIEANPKGVNAVAYSKDGKLLAAGCADGSIVTWSVAGAKATPRAAFAAHGSSAVTSVAFSPNGQSLLSAGADGLVRQWDVGKKPAKIAEFKGHAGGVTGVAWSPDGGTIASSSSDWTVRLWDVATRRERVPPDGPLSHVYALAFSQDATTLATGSWDGFVRLSSVAGDAPRERSTFKGTGTYVYSLAYAPDGKTLASGEHASAVHFWNVVNAARPSPAGQLKDLPGSVYSLAYTPDGSRLLVHHYPTAGLYDVRSRARVHAFEADPKGLGIAGIALSPDGSLVAGASGNYLKKGNDYVKDKMGNFVYFDPFLRLWDAETGKLLHKEGLTLPANTVAFTPDGRQAASGGWEPILRFWDVRGEDVKQDDKPLRPALSMPSGGAQVSRIVYSPDGRYFLTHGNDYHVVVWEAASRKKLYDWSLPEYTAMQAFAPDSRHLAISLGTGVTYILRLDGTATSAAK
jgi:WD40 repeat protein